MTGDDNNNSNNNNGNNNDNGNINNNELTGETNTNENSGMDQSMEEHVNKKRKKNNSSRITSETNSESSTSDISTSRRNLRSKSRNKSNYDSDDENNMFSGELIINKEYLKKLETDIKFRMKLAKMRVTPNAHSQVQQYNIQSIPEIIPDHNDPYKIEWTSTENKEKYFVGLKVINL